MDPRELVARAHVVALPLRERFRGIVTREALLIEGQNAVWAEWSPFIEYADAEAARWLGSALEVFAAGGLDDLGGSGLDTPTASATRPAGGLDRGSSSRAAASPRGSSSREAAYRDLPAPTVRVNATVPAVAPDAVPDILARFPGARTAKVKVAERGQRLADDLARVRAVRDVLGPAGRIRVDANAAWSLDEATLALEALAPLDLEYAEQPVASVADLATLRARLAGAVRIAADESVRKPADPLDVVRAGAADVIVLKLQPLGGRARALEIARAAAAEADVAFVTSSALETSVGLAAAARFAHDVDIAFSSDLDHGLGTAALLAADVTAEPLLPVDGRTRVRPVVADPGLLERHAAPPERIAFWHERLSRCLGLVD
ncbi:MAG TPA: o-succinylbenzoate synthase [Microbacteriaceae bacterium]|nr:o-succinylbenzoate synthase [Microbacteriaceae bacterium]